MPERSIHATSDLPEAPHSYWMASTAQTHYPPLTEDTEADAAIVGGGMTGITLAYLLKKEGLKVILLEADRIVQGTTGHTTAKITSQHTLIYDKIRKKMGEEKARQYAEANETAIGTISEMIAENGIDCDFHPSSAYVYTHQDSYIRQIEDEVKTASSLGIRAHYLDEIPLPFQVKAAMRFDGQARFHPRKYLLALAEKIPGAGSGIFEQTRVIDVREGEPCSVITANGKKVSAPAVVLGCHYPFYDRHGMYFTRLYPERSYALGVTFEGSFPEGMFITAEDPGRSVRLQPYEGRDLLVVSGEHHKTGHGENTWIHYKNLAEFVRENFKVTGIPYRWSTQDYSTPDEVPYTGRLTSDRRNIYIATGYRKWGMTNSTASAMILRDLIVKGESPWQDVYNPSRFTPAASAKNFIVENADVAKLWIGGKLAGAPDHPDIAPGQAKVVDLDGEKAGVYKDARGKIHVVDTTCTHMLCEMKWNAAELSWDCPCHGSRFTYEGDIIEGPALKSIKPEIREDQESV